MKNPPSILNYADYRRFLRDEFQHRKAKNPAYSYSAYSKAIGLSGNSSLIKILNYSRGAGPSVIERMVRYFAFSEKESTYFRKLVEISKTKETSNRYFEVLENLRKLSPRAEFRSLSESEFSLLSDWWNYVIRQMIRLPGFSGSVDEVARRLLFKVRRTDLVGSIRQLANAGLLSRDPDSGHLSASVARVRSSHEVPNAAIARYHHQTLGLAQVALSNVALEDRNFLGYALPVASSKVPELKRRLTELLDQFVDETVLVGATENTANVIYQLQMQFFPVTKVAGPNPFPKNKKIPKQKQSVPKNPIRSSSHSKSRGRSV